METAGVPAAPVNSLADAVRSEQVAQHNFLIDLPAPSGIDGQVQLPGTAFNASEDFPGTDRPPPRLGEHTEEILGEFGYSDTEVADLRERQIV